MGTSIVTGGLGFIGSYICRYLIANGISETVVALDHFGRYVSPLRSDFVDFGRYRLQGLEDRVVIERGDAKYFRVIADILRRYRPDYVFHLGSAPLAQFQNLDVEEIQEGCVTATTNILEGLNQMKRQDGFTTQRFVYISSSMVYGDWEKSEADEEHPLNPKDIYGTMKLAGEIVTRGLSECYQIRSTIIRPSAVYGPYDMNRRVSQIFLQKAINNEVIDVHGVDEKLDFSYVKDVAEGIALAATQEGGIDEVFNITGGQAYTLLDFVGILKRHFPNLSYNVMERDEKRPRRGKLSIAKAGSLLGYRPKYDLERGIKEYLDTCQELFTNTRR